MVIPHPDQETFAVRCAVITVSDTRTPETDLSGQLIQERLTSAGHEVEMYLILRDEPEQIKDKLEKLAENLSLDVVILNGGTGIAPRDTTYDAVIILLDKTLPGFGELFRFLSYQEIGSRAIASRAIAGVYKHLLIFSLPGSSNAVKLALDKLIVPELIHLTQQLKAD